MGVRISDDKNVCLYCSTTGLAFGPVMRSVEDAEGFLDLLEASGTADARKVAPMALQRLYGQWVAARDSELSDPKSTR